MCKKGRTFDAKRAQIEAKTGQKARFVWPLGGVYGPKKHRRASLTGARRMLRGPSARALECGGLTPPWNLAEGVAGPGKRLIWPPPWNQERGVTIGTKGLSWSPRRRAKAASSRRTPRRALPASLTAAFDPVRAALLTCSIRPLEVFT